MSDDVFNIKRGDTSPAIIYALDPATVNLTGATVLVKMRARGGAMLFSRAAVVVTLTGTPTVRYNWQAGDTAVAGSFEMEFQVTYADATIESFPNDGFIPVRITEDII